MKIFVSRIIFYSKVSRRYISIYSTELILNNENKKKCIEKFSKMSIRSTTNTTTRQAAVLVPVCQTDGELALLYTLRAADLKSHRGQVSFPGGMLDKGDGSLENAALRETEEELGIPRQNIEIWCSGKPLLTKLNTSVVPVIGIIKTPVAEKLFKLNPKEVEEAFTVPLKYLCAPEKIGYTQFKEGYSMPVFLGGRNRIWGLTAVITHMFLTSLLPTSLYNHKIKYISHIDKIRTKH